MKKKRGVIAVLLILALLVLGIGYAALSTPLTISGSATATGNNNNFSVVFANKNNAEADVTTTNEPSYVDDDVADKSFSGYEVTQTVTDGTTSASFSVKNLTTDGDKVVLTFPIENRSEFDANVEVTTEASSYNSEYFTISTVCSGTVTAGSSINAVVTVQCIKTPTVEVESGTVNITLTATSVN